MSKVKVITGANRGIGLELVKVLSSHGDKIIATARDPDAATALKAIPNLVGIVKLDLGDLDSLAPAATEIARLAPDGIDELWNVCLSGHISIWTTKLISSLNRMQAVPVSEDPSHSAIRKPSTRISASTS